MTKTLILTAALMLGTAAAATTVDGCEMQKADNGNYFFKVDPTCAFDRSGLGEVGDGKLNPANEAE